MVGILDLGPLDREVTVVGRKVKIVPMSVAHIFTLIGRFQTFQRLMANAGVDKKDEARVGMQMLGPDALAYCIVACMGGADLTKAERHAVGTVGSDGYNEKLEAAKAVKWKKAEERARQLGAGDVFIILEAMYELTFPDGFGPFVKRFMAMQKKSEEMNLAATSDEDSSDAFELDDPKGKYGVPRQGKSTPGSNSTKKTALHS